MIEYEIEDTSQNARLGLACKRRSNYYSCLVKTKHNSSVNCEGCEDVTIDTAPKKKAKIHKLEERQR